MTQFTCNGLNKNGPHRCTGSATIKSFDPVGVGEALEEVCHLGQTFRSQILKPGLQIEM